MKSKKFNPVNLFGDVILVQLKASLQAIEQFLANEVKKLSVSKVAKRDIKDDLLRNTDEFLAKIRAQIEKS